MENKKTNILCESLQLCRYQFLNHFMTVKTVTILVLLAVVISFHLRPVARFAIAQGISVAPWIFPFMPSDYMLQIILVAGAVFLMSDAPFKNENHFYLLYRAGTISWSIGTILYMIVVSVVYTLSIWGIALFSLADVIQFDGEWGKILGTLAQNPRVLVDYEIPMVFNYTIFQYTPIRATIYSILLECGCILWIGLAIYIGNEFLKHYMGIIIAFAYLFLDVMIYNVMSRNVYRYSPLSICQLGYFNGDMRRVGITLSYAVKFFSISIGCFILFILVAGNRKRIWRYLKESRRKQACKM